VLNAATTSSPERNPTKALLSKYACACSYLLTCYTRPLADLLLCHDARIRMQEHLA
jgi:hypothetical protein